jgi:hypothetical protein
LKPEKEKKGEMFLFDQLVVVDPRGGAAIVELKPGQSATNTYELLPRFRRRDLSEGKYYLHAVYHLSDYFAPDYSTNVILSNSVEFTVVEAPEAEKQALVQLEQALQSANTQENIKALHTFLDRHPQTVRRVDALDELFLLEYEAKNWVGVVDICRKFQREKISPTKRDLMRLEAAYALMELNDIKGAIMMLKDSTFPFSIHERQRWEKQLEETAKP